MPKIKIIGIGGCGCKQIDSLINLNNGISYMTIDTEVYNNRLESKNYKSVVLSKENLISEDISIDDKNEIRNNIIGYDVVFILCGLGGKIGSKLSNHVSDLCKENNIFSVCIVNTPFSFEGKNKITIAKECINYLEKTCNLVFSISNDELLESTQKNDSIELVFENCRKRINHLILSIISIISQSSLDLSALDKIKNMTIYENKTWFSIIQNNIEKEVSLLNEFDTVLIDIILNKNKNINYAKGILDKINEEVNSKVNILFSIINDDIESNYIITLIGVKNSKVIKFCKKNKDEDFNISVPRSLKQKGIYREKKENSLMNNISNKIKNILKKIG